jgi:hypothetical protein
LEIHLDKVEYKPAETVIIEVEESIKDSNLSGRTVVLTISDGMNDLFGSDVLHVETKKMVDGMAIFNYTIPLSSSTYRYLVRIFDPSIIPPLDSAMFFSKENASKILISDVPVINSTLRMGQNLNFTLKITDGVGKAIPYITVDADVNYVDCGGWTNLLGNVSKDRYASDSVLEVSMLIPHGLPATYKLNILAYVFGIQEFQQAEVKAMKFEVIGPSECETSVLLQNLAGYSLYSQEADAEHVYVKSSGETGNMLVSWNYKEGKGLLITFQTDSGRTISRFKPTKCEFGSGVSNCIIAQPLNSREGTIATPIRINVGYRELLIKMLDKGGPELAMEVSKLRKWAMDIMTEEFSKVVLKEGQREGPLLVQETHPDMIIGLNFLDYPASRNEGLPITLRIGEHATNGCTVTLTLLEIDDKSATFLKTIEMNKPYSICWNEKDSE